ncbi:MAG: thiamine phosphate synthase [Polyangiales bacterium]
MILPRLWLITDPQHPRGTIWPIAEALRAADKTVGVQLRAKSASTNDLLKWALDLRELTEAKRLPFFVNGRVDVALASSADGVHLGERGLLPTDVRKQWGKRLSIGVSRHDATGIAPSAIQETDFVFVSPVFQTPNKNAPLGIKGFETLARECDRPIYALGGVQLDSVDLLLKAGAYGVAIIRPIMLADQPAKVMSTWLEALHRPQI